MNVQPSAFLRPILQFTMVLLLGNLSAVLAFIAIVSYDHHRATRNLPGLGAVAGGWDLALRTPLNLCLLSIAFGIGMWLGVRLNAPGTPTVPPPPSPPRLPHP
jgi:hypothetical protein